MGQTSNSVRLVPPLMVLRQVQAQLQHQLHPIAREDLWMDALTCALQMSSLSAWSRASVVAVVSLSDFVFSADSVPVILTSDAYCLAHTCLFPSVGLSFLDRR